MIKLFLKFANILFLFPCVDQSVGPADLIPDSNLFDVNGLRNDRFCTMLDQDFHLQKIWEGIGITFTGERNKTCQQMLTIFKVKK